MELDTTSTYTDLGEAVNEKGNIRDHIKSIKGKVEAAYQTGNKDLNIADIETTWKLIAACILPILYAADTWNKRTIQTLTSNPREYVETDRSIEHVAQKNNYS